MWSRSRVDIGWDDLLAALFATFNSARGRDLDIAQRWDRDGAVFFTVRTAWDALLTELALPPGRALVSAINIPDMFELLEHHGLEVVPVDVDPRTLAPPPGAFAAKLDGDTRLVLATHLLGARLDMDALHSELEAAGALLPVIEDCAQAFEGPHERGHPRSLAALFSFGPIKSSSALGGCLARIRDPELRDRMLTRTRCYPRQRRRDYLGVVAKYSALKALSTPRAYATFVGLCAQLGRSHDDVINGAVLGLAGDDYWAALRRRPSPALLALLERRMDQFDGQRLAHRRAHGEQLAASLGQEVTILGAEATTRGWWQFALVCEDTRGLITRLRAAGFDATTGSSRLGCPEPAQGASDPCPQARSAMAKIVYVPAYPELPTRALTELAELICGGRVGHST